MTVSIALWGNVAPVRENPKYPELLRKIIQTSWVEAFNARWLLATYRPSTYNV